MANPACEGTVGYTYGMKTAISIPDKVFKEAERLARRLGQSRSKLYGEGVAETRRKICAGREDFRCL
jgi:hypothetical protein